MRENVLNFIFGLSSLLGIVITAGLTWMAIQTGAYEPDAKGMIIGLAIANLSLSMICVFLFIRGQVIAEEKWRLTPKITANQLEIASLSNELKGVNSNFEEVADILHSIHDQLRDRMFELRAMQDAILIDDYPAEADLIDLSRTNEMFYLFVVNNVKNIMDILTGDKCSVCIKVLEENDSGIVMVRTFMRDSSSYRERKLGDQGFGSYPYYENTAFKLILSNSPVSIYFSDDLSKEPTYVNSNSNWRHLYNSTLVCPIRMELISAQESDKTEYSTLGFLCIDNKRGGLGKRACVQVAAAISDSLFNHLLLLNAIEASGGISRAEDA